MIDALIAFSIRYRVPVILAALLLALAGVVAAYRTPMDAIPDLSENQVLVFTPWPGHSPREIEDQVSYPLSLELQGLAGVRVVRSSSDVGFSMISVIFDDSVSPATARRQVGERLAGAARLLPAGVAAALSPDAAATGQIFWYTLEGKGHDLGRLRALQDWYVRPQLASVPGVAEVASVGGFAPEYLVEVDPLKLQDRRVPLAAVHEAVARSNAAVGGDVLHKANAEFVVRGVGWLGAGPDSRTAEERQRQVLRDLELVVIVKPGGSTVRLGEVASVSLGASPRRGMLEKDGDEVTGGVVMMRQGENPLEVTRRLKRKIVELRAGLPEGVRVVPVYDRTPLIEGAVGTVTGTLLEAMLTATVCVLLVLRHLRTSFVITLTLPLAVLASFVLMFALRKLGIVDVQTNIMSLAGLAVSVGVLVDSSVVMAENVMHRLKGQFGDQPVTGDTREHVLAACRTVGRPIFFSVLIMLLSFLPVFALGGIEGRMFHPLAFTKSFALAAVALLSVTLVPALCTYLIKGRLKGELEIGLVRGVIQVYRPVLGWLLDRPAVIVWVVAVTFLLGVAPVGERSLLLGTLAIALVAGIALLAPPTPAPSKPGAPARVASPSLALRAWTERWRPLAVYAASLVLIALVAEQRMTPMGREFMTPLDEGMTMDMPITVPRASITQSADDLKARDMIFCRFPEVGMVVGKAGRAETPADPAPLDMIETMIDFRLREVWPKRKLLPGDAERQAAAVLDAALRDGLIREPEDRAAFAREVSASALARFDALMREAAYQRNRPFEHELGQRLTRFAVARLTDARADLGLDAADYAALTAHADHLAMTPTLEDVTLLADDTARRLVQRGRIRSAEELTGGPRLGDIWRAARAAPTGEPASPYSRLLDAVQAEHRRLWALHIDHVNDELLERAAPLFTRVVLEELFERCPLLDSALAARWDKVKRFRDDPPARAHTAGHHHHGTPPLPDLDPLPEIDAIQQELSARFARGLLLWQKDRADLVGFGGELDRVMQMPGWTNVWTMPIQNRVDMLSTGVNTDIGVRVLGRRLEDVVKASEDVAAALKKLPGAVNVVADPLRGKGYVEVHPDRDRAARLGVGVGAINDVVETALGGKVVTTTVEGRERHPVRVRFPRSWREDEESVRRLPVPRPDGRPPLPLSAVADVRVTEGPATIKGENGLLRNYVRLNVRGRDAAAFVEEGRRAVAAEVTLPAGVYVEWTGQFEHEVQARRTLAVIVPAVIALIFAILYLTYRDLADAGLMLLAVPGAVAGGLLFQWLFGVKFSVTVWVGYIACFGMATSTGIIMLVYLREAVAKAGGLEAMTLPQLREAVLDGAAHRLRPKLLTEGATILGLAPLLWATGPGSEVLRPMVIPVLGGLLIADEVIDLFLPVLFHAVRVRRWRRLHADGEG
jgi:Cu(I)/Ag(I) efflux system membrane protein CusA/SilA